MTKDLLIRYLDNNCTEAELHEVLQWAKKEALSEKGKKLGLDDWENYHEEDDLGSTEKFTTLFDKIQEKIEGNQDQKKIEDKTFTLSVFANWLTRAAAILLIPVIAFLFYTLSEKKIELAENESITVDTLEVIAPIGSRTVVQLSDGSQVYLNYGSKIKYPQFFSGDTREITLIGEGFFDVSHNPEKPFIVKTGNLNIKAVGTAFNVHSYPDNDVIETTLVDGKVVLEQNMPNGTIKTLGAMEPGQHVEFNLITRDITGTKGNIEKYISWKDGKVIFEDTPIAEVAEILNRMFNVEISLEGEIEDFIYTVTFVDEPLFQILDLMTIATPVNYKSFPRNKLTDGTYSKQKILITKRQSN